LSATVDPPLHGVALYNPNLLNRDELTATFIARGRLLERLVDALRRQTVQTGGGQHTLVIGRRGMGKTTLLQRLRYAIEDDRELAARYLALVFPEEQYDVAHLAHFWLNCLHALGDALEHEGRDEDADALDEALTRIPQSPPEARRAEAEALIRTWSRELDRRLVLLVDNIDLVLKRLPEADEWALREALSAPGGPIIVGASTTALETTYTYEKAFYDFFRVEILAPLDDDESFAVLSGLAEHYRDEAVPRVLGEQPGRIKALRALAGGTPRTIVALYALLSKDAAGDVRTDLERLLDGATPLYKAQFEALPQFAQRVVHALAIGWDPMTARDVSDATEMPINNTSSQLARLVDLGVVEKVDYPGARTGFQVAERLFNIWYLMRARRRVRRRLEWLVRFLEMFFSPSDLDERSTALSRNSVSEVGDVERERSAPATSLRVACARICDDWNVAASSIEECLQKTDGDYEGARFDLLVDLFFAEAVNAGRTADARQLLEEAGYAERWRPLAEALTAIAEGSRAHLLRLAPEVRLAAAALVDRLAPDLK